MYCYVPPSAQVFFIELICDNEELIEENIKVRKCIRTYMQREYICTYVQIMPCKSVLKCLTASVTKHTLQSHCHEDGACLSNEFTLFHSHVRTRILQLAVYGGGTVCRYIRTHACIRAYVRTYNFVFYCTCVRFALV